jgi:hypothetical protein
MTEAMKKANHTFQFIVDITQEGKPVFHGSAIYNTNSTGKLHSLISDAHIQRRNR